MARRYNLWAFYLCLLTILFFLNLIFSDWIVSPPSYILFLFAVIAFIVGIFGLKDKRNKVSTFRSWFTIILSLLLSMVLFLGILLNFFISETLFKTTSSPNGNYEIEFYLTNGGATTAFGVIGKLDGPLWFEKTIYDDYRMDHANVEWIDDHTVLINNHRLDLKKGETYSD